MYTPSFIMMAVANLFTVSSFGCFFLFPLFISGHGGGKTDIGIIMGVTALSAVLCRPWVSEMIDRVGRKRSYTVGCLIMGLTPLIYLSFDGDVSTFYVPLIFVRILHGIGLAICFTGAFTYVADIIPEARLNEGLGIFGITGLMGLAIGPVIAEIVINGFGFSIFFLTAAVLGLIGLMIHLPLAESYMCGPREDTLSFFSILVKTRIFTVALMALLFGIGLAAAGSFVAPFAAEKHLSLASLYFVAYSSAAVVTRLFGGRLTDRVGEHRIMPYAFILTSAGLFSLVLPGGNLLLLVSGLLSGCGHGLLFPSLNAMAIRHEPIYNRGKITGVFTGGIDAGAFVGSVVLGFIGDWAGFHGIFAAAGFALLLGLGIYWLRMTRD